MNYSKMENVGDVWRLDATNTEAVVVAMGGITATPAVPALMTPIVANHVEKPENFNGANFKREGVRYTLTITRKSRIKTQATVEALLAAIYYRCLCRGCCVDCYLPWLLFPCPTTATLLAPLLPTQPGSYPV
ncbi:Processive diacylglycerol beta-glucosyltransferase [Actinidia chinensis var. chinensis]|uniref:Processive diacylglycerol beta-glucosyltransferase n=1 Tax=Actinidia chinensis var. chinensis TaxID=1590841 RepID=A0A2R6QHK2_ACTCC|nr:Processive diacylglycerol beta-glucosyltransferase [Actinidia chinensis var. chinensis]